MQQQVTKATLWLEIRLCQVVNMVMRGETYVPSS